MAPLLGLMPMVLLAAGAAGSPPPVPAQLDLSTLPLLSIRGVGRGYLIYLEPGEIAGQSKGPSMARLAGVQPPAVGSPAEQETLRSLRSLLEGERVWLLQVPTLWADSAAVYLYRWPDGLCINLEVVRQGYAWADEHTAMQMRPEGHSGFQPGLPLAPARMLEALKYWQERAAAARKGLHRADAPTSAPATRPTVAAAGVQPAAFAAPAGEPPSADEVVVYVTASGTKYHRADCPSLRRSRSEKAIPLKQARQRYEPCRMCRPAE